MTKSRRVMAVIVAATFDCCDDITGAGGEGRGGRKAESRGGRKAES